jgi:hypothetical protein
MKSSMNHNKSRELKTVFKAVKLKIKLHSEANWHYIITGGARSIHFYPTNNTICCDKTKNHNLVNIKGLPRDIAIQQVISSASNGCTLPVAA